MSGHIILLGDSIFDNKSYTRGEPDVVEHLRAMLLSPWRATLLAVDGATTTDVARQFQLIPADATHLVLSLGGNDALLNSDLLSTPLRSSSEALLMFAARLEPFESAYRQVLTSLRSRGGDLTICTIYEGALEHDYARLAKVALMTFNDVILRVAFECGANVIDLRQVCVESADYANPIEPSGIGGRKIARAIARAVGAIPGAVVSRVSGG